MPKDASLPDKVPDLGLDKLFTVKGKVAVVTGGGSGIGKMIATAYVQNGAKVYISSRKMDELRKTADQLSKIAASPSAFDGPACIPIQSDLSSKSGCDNLADEIKKKEKRIDILVNNSGASWGAPLTDFPEASGWDKIMNLNVKALFYLTVALLPLLEVGKDNINPGSVINVSSVAGISPMAEGALSAPGSGTYSYQPSKAAAMHLTRTLALTLAEKHVTANAIAPGVYPSRMTAYGIKNYGEEFYGAGALNGRIGTPEDIAGLALYLGSRAASHTTGTVITSDGGTALQYMSRL